MDMANKSTLLQGPTWTHVLKRLYKMPVHVAKCFLAKFVLLQGCICTSYILQNRINLKHLWVLIFFYFRILNSWSPKSLFLILLPPPSRHLPKKTFLLWGGLTLPVMCHSSFCTFSLLHQHQNLPKLLRWQSQPRLFHRSNVHLVFCFSYQSYWFASWVACQSTDIELKWCFKYTLDARNSDSESWVLILCISHSWKPIFCFGTSYAIWMLFHILPDKESPVNFKGICFLTHWHCYH